jgi:hypothetical protein
MQSMCVQFSAKENEQMFAVKRVFEVLAKTSVNRHQSSPRTTCMASSMRSTG